MSCYELHALLRSLMGLLNL
ncbi:Protein of unknown function [Pyronema omphalodes CBS 100304]|uniref:Uncharacterized protein n=1 Tax=Pyronema omphalodes (strain CBS 100304) TaxID=1076935 RepID=U4LRP4_PYROM|nr:Protein of unknown function [Pyronema omphalodes CBS 100304]